MIYHLNSNHRGRGKPPFVIVALLSIFVFCISVLFGFYNASVHQFFAPVSHVVFYPVSLVGNGVKNVGLVLYSVISDKETLVRENLSLHQEQDALTAITAERDMLLAENTSLKEMLGRPSSRESVRATVLAAPDQSPYDTFLIDVGSDHGLKADQMVMANGVMIGSVEEVYSGTALVRLFSSPGQEYDVRIGPFQTLAKAKGLGGGNFEVILPRGVDIKEGDSVIIPAINPQLFGVIEKVGLGSSETFQRILFKNPFAMSDISYVSVLVK